MFLPIMENASVKWLRESLGPRLDALEVGLKDLIANEPEAASSIRRLARSLLTPADDYDLQTIYQSAKKVEESPDDALLKSTRALMQILRDEVTKAVHLARTVLIIGGDPDFNDKLVQTIHTLGRDVLCAETSREAEKLLRKHKVVFIILNAPLPDRDSRDMLMGLRENILTASIPILVLATKGTEAIKDESLEVNADGYMERPVDTEEVVNWIKTRSRRTHDIIKEARRDSLTGLLNRAALCEEFARILEICNVSHEPLALAVLAIDEARNIQEIHGQETINRVLQRVGLLLSSSVRASDIVGRWGDPEFVALFPCENQFGGTRAVEKVLEAVQKESFNASDGSSFRVTLSAGITLVSPESSVDKAMAGADRYLFQAKSAGGNRVASSQSQIPKRTERILIIEHDKLVARVLKKLFESEGMEVTHTDSAGSGISSAADTQKFHLILIDEQLPDRSGFDVLQELRRIPRNNRIPMVMLTSQNSEESMIRALELGANDYVTRPIFPFTFMTRMRRLLTKGVLPAVPVSETHRILVVCDEAKTLLMAASALHKRGGFQVYLGKRALDGYQRFNEERPDVLLLDFEMPHINGAHLLKMIRKTSGWEETDVIFAAEAENTDQLKKLLPMGIKGVITKPLKPLTLAKEVEKILGIAPSAERPATSTDHLNNEIQRIMPMKTHSGSLLKEKKEVEWI